jgi:hypothetical protein
MELYEAIVFITEQKVFATETQRHRVSQKLELATGHVEFVFTLASLGSVVTPW